MKTKKMTTKEKAFILLERCRAEQMDSTEMWFMFNRVYPNIPVDVKEKYITEFVASVPQHHIKNDQKNRVSDIIYDNFGMVVAGALVLFLIVDMTIRHYLK